MIVIVSAELANTHLVIMVDLIRSHLLHSNASGSHPESSSPGSDPFLDSKWLDFCLQQEKM